MEIQQNPHTRGGISSEKVKISVCTLGRGEGENNGWHFSLPTIVPPSQEGWQDTGHMEEDLNRNGDKVQGAERVTGRKVAAKVGGEKQISVGGKEGMWKCHSKVRCGRESGDSVGRETSIG